MGKYKEAQEYANWVARKLRKTPEFNPHSPDCKLNIAEREQYERQSGKKYRSETGHAFLEGDKYENIPRVYLDFTGSIYHIHPPKNKEEEMIRTQDETLLNKQLSDLSWLMQTIMNRRGELSE